MPQGELGEIPENPFFQREQFFPFGKEQARQLEEYFRKNPDQNKFRRTLQKIVYLAGENAEKISFDGVKGVGKSQARRMLAEVLRPKRPVLEMKSGGFVEPDEINQYGLKFQGMERIVEELLAFNNRKNMAHVLDEGVVDEAAIWDKKWGIFGDNRSDADIKEIIAHDIKEAVLAGEQSWHTLQKAIFYRLSMLDPADTRPFLITERGPVNRILAHSTHGEVEPRFRDPFATFFWHPDFDGLEMATNRLHFSQKGAAVVRMFLPDLVFCLTAEKGVIRERIEADDKEPAFREQRANSLLRNYDDFNSLARRMTVIDPGRYVIIDANMGPEKVVEQVLERMKKKKMLV